MKLVAEVVSPLLVTVTNGTNIVVDTICRNLNYEVQNQKFATDMRPFPLGGSGIILGVDWLKAHNPITLDYHQMSIAIQKSGKWITLQGSTQEGRLQTISSKNLGKLLKKVKVLHRGVFV